MLLALGSIGALLRISACLVHTLVFWLFTLVVQTQNIFETESLRTRLCDLRPEAGVAGGAKHCALPSTGRGVPGSQFVRVVSAACRGMYVYDTPPLRMLMNVFARASFLLAAKISTLRVVTLARRIIQRT